MNHYEHFGLIIEVINNGFKKDLCFTKYDLWNNLFTFLKMVNEKMDHPMHKQMQSPLHRSHMLALILYTDCDCNYDLCREQRNRNYSKWKAFDRILYCAIYKLSQFEKISNLSLYSGLTNAKADENDNKLKGCYFPTYVSASWDKCVSLTFVQKRVMLIEFDNEICNQISCCTVDWISKFPDECEVLIARTDRWNNLKFD